MCSSDLHEAVVDGRTGFVVSPSDVAGVRAAVHTLLDDPELRTRMGAAARRRAVEGFSYDGLVAQLLPLARGDFSAVGTLAR